MYRIVVVITLQYTTFFDSYRMYMVVFQTTIVTNASDIHGNNLKCVIRYATILHI